MGSCLSKSGKKGKGDDEDKAPYSPAEKSPTAVKKQKDLEEIPLKQHVRFEKGDEPATVKQESQRQPSKQETVKPPVNETQPSPKSDSESTTKHHKPAPLSPIIPDDYDIINLSDVNFEVKSSQQRVVTSTSHSTTYSGETPAKSGPESQFRANYVKEVRTPTDFPDPRSPTAKFSAVAEGTRTPTDFTDPRSPTTKFTKFDSQIQRTVTTKRTVIRNGEETTQLTESKSMVTHHDEGEGAPKIDLKSIADDPQAIAEVVRKLQLDDPEDKVDTKVTEAVNESEDGKTSSYIKATEQSGVSEDGLRTSVRKEVLTTTSTINTIPVEPKQEVKPERKSSLPRRKTSATSSSSSSSSENERKPSATSSPASPFANGTKSPSLSPTSPSGPETFSPTHEPGTYVEAKVVIQSPVGSEPQSAVNGGPSSGEASPSHEEYEPFEPEADEEKHPLPVVNLKNQIQQLLNNFAPTNDELLNQHQLYENTRVKLFQSIDNWFGNNEKTKPVTVITGPAGIGKTCVAAEVCRRYAKNLAGYHFFDRCTTNTGQNNLRSVILSMAYHFCDVFPHYLSTLPNINKIKETLAHGDVTDVYDTFLFNPLISPALKHPEYEPRLVVLDAIDQCDHVNMDTLVEILQTLNENAPKWFHIIVTTVNNNQILSKLDHVHTLELKKSNDNMLDVKRYLKEPLGKYMDRISLDGGLTQLAKKTGGLFISANILAKQLDKLPSDTKIAMRQIDQMFPTGFSDICKVVCTKYKDSLGNLDVGHSSKTAYNIILSCLLNIREPIHKTFVVDALGLAPNTDVDPMLEELSPVLYEVEGKIHINNTAINEWLVNSKTADENVVDSEVGKEMMAELCIKWLKDLIEDDGSSNRIHHDLRKYALRRILFHLLEVPKQHEVITNVLCNLKCLQERLSISQMTPQQVLREYHHNHTRTNPDGTNDVISLREYMKSNQKYYQQIQSFEKFLSEKKYDIEQSPDFLLNIAASYSSVDRIKQNARLELEGKPWIEDVTSIPQTNCLERSIPGTIKAIDMSPDGKTLAAVVKDADYNVKLHLISATNGEDKITPLNIKPLSDRVGIAAKFLGQDNLIFVGSLTTFVTNTGKQVQSGLDVTTVGLKEKFSIECCDSSSRFLACGLTTFPWGGKSLHMCVIDLKNKKCAQTIEVLRFRFGGSAQCSIKACGVGRTQPYVCACVKQNPKAMERIVVWNVTKWQVTNSIDVHSDDFTKVAFVGDGSLILGGGIRSAGKGGTFIPVWSEQWQFKDVTNKTSVKWNSKDTHSLFATQGDAVISVKWKKDDSTAVLEKFTSCPFDANPQSTKYKIRGLTDVGDILMDSSDNVVFVGNDDIAIYSLNDLDRIDDQGKSTAIPTISDVNVHSIAFLPKSDSIVLVAQTSDGDSDSSTHSAFIADLQKEDVVLTPTPFRDERAFGVNSFNTAGQFNTFRGAGTSSEMCFPSADGNYIVFNNGESIQVWDRINDKVKTLPSFEVCKDKSDSNENNAGVKCIASTKDNTAALVYAQQPHRAYIYDLRSGNQLRKLELKDDVNKTPITDLVFLPSSGQAFMYTRGMNNTLSAWNTRNGECLSTANIPISYARVSTASDRIAISARKAKKEGQILLRNNDGKVNRTLDTKNTWMPSHNESDFEFSQDGTTLIGVCSVSGVCRVWNAGNGEVLSDLDLTFTCDAEVVGMLTNSHALLHDDRFLVTDVATNCPSAVAPLDLRLDRKSSPRGVRMSPKGQVLTGATVNGRLVVFRCHGFATAKRSTTLQRMKSITKSP